MSDEMTPEQAEKLKVELKADCSGNIDCKEPVTKISGDGSDTSDSVQATSSDRPIPTVHRRFRIGVWNAHSLNEKCVAVSRTIVYKNLDLLLITESWQQSSLYDIDQISVLSGYNRVDCPRPGADPNKKPRGGGIVVYYRDTLTVLTMTLNVIPSTFELLAVEVLLDLPHGSLTVITIITIYRPPSTSEKTFLEELTSLLEQFDLDNIEIVIAGDFNLHLEDPTKHGVKKFRDIMKRFGLTQHVDGPTHKDGGWLDVFITQDDTSLIDLNIDHLTLSDHSLVVATVGDRMAAGQDDSSTQNDEEDVTNRFSVLTVDVARRMENNSSSPQNSLREEDLLSTMAKKLSQADAEQLKSELKQVFDAVDADGSGQLDVTEFEKILGTVNASNQSVRKLSDSEIKQLSEEFIRDADKNADGKVTFVEFHKYVLKSFDVQE